MRLHDNEGQWNDDIKRSYDPATTPALQAMIGQSIAGQWVLSVRDTIGGDVGPYLLDTSTATESAAEARRNGPRPVSIS